MSRRTKSTLKAPPNITTRNLPDLIEKKRVRFADSEMDSRSEYAPDASVRKRKAAQSPRSEGAKTSEYAYFRKIKKRSTHDSCAYREDKQVQSSKVMDRPAGRETFDSPSTSNTFNKKWSFCKDQSSSFPGQGAGPVDNHLVLSPLGGQANNKLDQISRKAILRKPIQRSPFLSKNVNSVDKLFFSSPSSWTSESVNQCSEKGIFAAKREKLRQCAADTLSEAGELNSKGQDLVSLLLARLYPKRHGDDFFQDSRCTKEGSDIKCTSSNYRESHVPEELQLFNTMERDVPGKELQLLYTMGRDVPGKELQLFSTMERDVPGKELQLFNTMERDIYSGRPKEEVLLKRAIYASDFSLSKCKIETNFEFVLDNRVSNSKMFRDLYREHDDSDYLCQPKGLAEVYFPAHDKRKGPQNLFLEWEFREKEDIFEPLISSHDGARKLWPRLGNSWNLDHCLPVDSIFDVKALHPSSSSSKCCLDFDSMQNYYPSMLQIEELGADLLNERQTLAKREQFLALPRTQKYLENRSWPNNYSTSSGACSWPSDYSTSSGACSWRDDYSTSSGAQVYGQDLQYDDAMAEPDKFALASPFTSEYTTQVDYCSTGNLSGTEDISFSCQDPVWCMNKILRDKNSDEWEALFARAPSVTGGHLYTGHACQLPEIDEKAYHFSQEEDDSGDILIPFSSTALYPRSCSSTFQFSLNQLTGCPLLLDNVDPDKSDEMYLCDD